MAFAHGATDPVVPQAIESVSIQIFNPDLQTAVRVSLDGKPVFEGLPQASSLRHFPALPVSIGPLQLFAGRRHTLTAEVPGAATKASLEWEPRLDGAAWIVIRYYPGRGDAANPPFFTFALQPGPQKLR